MHHKVKLTALMAAALFVSGCNDSTNYDFAGSVTDAQNAYAEQTLADTSNTKAIFSPASGIIPTASDLLFSGSTDGTLNIPISEFATDGEKALFTQLNTLDGFSTVVPVTTGFSSSLDTSSIALGSSVFVFELNTINGEVLGIAKALTSPAEMVVQTIDTNATQLALVPTTPLKPQTKYFVVLTSDLKASDGSDVKADTTYALTKGSAPLTGDFAALEPLRQATNGLENLAAAAGIDKSKIVLSWTFTTQSMGESLTALAATDTASTINVQAATVPGTDPAVPLTTKLALDPTGANPAITGNADIYVGSITVPYYLNVGTSAQDTAPLTGAWSIDATTDLPIKKADVTIPVLMTVPNSGTAPANGYPVVLFQHGITANRTSLLAIGEALASAGFVGVAIDMPLHGLGPDSPFYAGAAERTFGLDFANNQSGAKGPDGTADDSGKYFINLESLLTSRDNLRQAVADLMVVRDSLASLDSVVSVDEDTVRFIGHSLGGMVGTTYLAFDNTVGAATLAMPGGGIAQLLRNSAAFGPVIDAGLAENGITKGSEAYTKFFAAAQWIVDAADPINHGAAASASHSIHMIEVVGGNSSPADQVIPNTVADAPLSGTDPLARVMGLTATTANAANAAGLHTLVQFNAGDHSSILLPTASLAATVEMQTQTAAFMATNGTQLPITNGSVIAQ